MNALKKDFSNLQNINSQIEATKNVFAAEQQPAAPAVTDAQEIERKSKRFNLMFKPSVYAQLQEAAAERGMSVGTFINALCVDYLKERNAAK